MPSDVAKLKAVRAEVNASLQECKAALEATGGDVEAAIAQLTTPEDRTRARSARLYANLSPATVGAEGLAPPPLVAATEDPFPVFARLADELRTDPIAWFGAPDPEAHRRLAERYERAFSGPLPARLGEFLATWNGAAPTPGGILWDCDRVDCAHDFDGRDDLPPECERSLTFMEVGEMGYVFLHVDGPTPGVYLYNRDDGRRPVVRIADSFEAFLRAWINAEFDVVDVMRDARLANGRTQPA